MRFDDKVNAFVTFQFKTHYEFFTNTNNALDKVNIINEKESHLPDIEYMKRNQQQQMMVIRMLFLNQCQM